MGIGEVRIGDSRGQIGTIGTIIAIADIPYIGTVGTILSANITVTVPPISTIAYVATIGTILSANISVTVPPISTIGLVATIGTILSQSNIAYIGTIGTIEFGGSGGGGGGGTIAGTVTTEPYKSLATLIASGSVVGAFVGTVDMSSWTQLSANITVGTITPSASLLAAMMGVDPVTNLIMSSILGSDWLINGQSQRLTANIYASKTVAITATIVGTVVGLTIDVERAS